MGNNLLIQDLAEVRENFKIENLESANWAFKKLRAIETKKAEIEALAAEELNRINTWKEAELKQYEGDRQYFEYLLSEYYQKEKAVDKKFKLSTPYGKVATRKISKWTYEEEALKDYIKANDLPFVRVKEEIDKAGLKKVFKDGINQETGEIVPGITIEDVETISVKVE